MSDPIFEALLTQASIKVNRMINKGKNLEESVKAVSAAMWLNENETSALFERAKKELPSKVEAPQEIKEDDVVVEAAEILPESMYFDTLEEVEQATGVLMHKGIAWGSKGTNADGNFLQFESQAHLEKAHEALKRRWDFVDNNPRKVAVMEFDNLQDYEKVLEFISKQGLMVEFEERDGDSLDEDLSVIEGMIREQTREATKASKNGFIPPEIMAAPVRSYKARPKEGRLDLTTLDVYEGRSRRLSRIRRRWR